ncbi:hypothetical protein HYPSUDRAFT_78649 [Hypholoma sublateritium FD-334 SS-4]|uniref:Uncharacterized protein n=1 Tax=Hypholoma sublateritium (strain FD-334 SS-4) TaxID=945553 RepID=A0A0D2NT16_HYPSF|nr:hypothetical protein HYPSUDRAFT_78649 [Hypholoma sublateritium FD-334 SS-4]
MSTISQHLIGEPHSPLETTTLYSFVSKMSISLAAECEATYGLLKYKDQQTNVEKSSGRVALVHNNNPIDSGIVTIVFCVPVATIFGADFFFLYHTAKKLLAVVIALGMGIATFTSMIIVACQSAWITGVSLSAAQQYLDIYFRPPLVYRHNAHNTAWVILIWLAFLSTLASTWLMFVAFIHDIQNGTTPGVVGDMDVESAPIHYRNSHHSMITSTAMRGEKPVQGT